MKNFFPFLLSGKFLLPLLILLVGIMLYSLWGRPPDIDDAWIGGDAYALARDGYVHTDLMRGINQQEEHFVNNYKLFNLQGALFIKVFGFSVYTLKSVSLVHFLVFLLLFYFYTVRWKRIFNKNDLLFSLVLIFTFPWIITYSFVYRPEIMLMTYGFIGFIFLEKYLDNPGQKSWMVFISGIWFGLAMAAHLNGLILATAAFILLLWDRKLVSSLVFGIGVVLSFMIYFYDYTDPSYFDLWMLQFFHAPYFDSIDAVPLWLKPLFNLLNEHIRYFHNYKIIVYSVFIIVTLMVGGKYIYKNQKTITRFAILVATLTGVLAMHKSQQYFLLNFPYVIILITLIFKALNDNKIYSSNERKSLRIKLMLGTLGIIFLVSSTYFNIKRSLDKFSPTQHRELALKYADGNEKEMNIVAPLTFIFNEVEHFKSIQGDLCYIQLQKMDPSVYGEGFLKKAATFDIELIMVEPGYQSMLGIETLKKGDVLANYKVIDITDHSMVFKRLR